jgi:hypothetical protein
MGLVAAALRTESGGVVGLRQRQAADEVEEFGRQLAESYGI